MSRLPRALEHLKTGFTAEAVAAAHYRAYAARAESDGLPNLAARWRRLAALKDALAVRQLEAAGRVHGGGADIQTAIADERYENDVLYPKMEGEVDGEAAQILTSVVAAQKEHLEELGRMRSEHQVESDVTAPTGG